MSTFTSAPPALIFGFVVGIAGFVVYIAPLGQLVMSLCSPTARYQRIEDDLEQLQGLVPEDDPGEFRNWIWRLRVQLDRSRQTISNTDVLFRTWTRHARILMDEVGRVRQYVWSFAASYPTQTGLQQTSEGGSAGTDASAAQERPANAATSSAA